MSLDHPGDPMTVVIGRTGLPRAQFAGSPLSKELVRVAATSVTVQLSAILPARHASNP